MHPAKIRCIGFLIMLACAGVGGFAITSMQDKEQAAKEVHGEAYETPLSEGLAFRGMLMVCMAGAVVGLRLMFHSSPGGGYQKQEVQFDAPDDQRRPI